MNYKNLVSGGFDHRSQSQEILSLTPSRKSALRALLTLIFLQSFLDCSHQTQFETRIKIKTQFETLMIQHPRCVSISWSLWAGHPQCSNSCPLPPRSEHQVSSRSEHGCYGYGIWNGWYLFYCNTNKLCSRVLVFKYCDNIVASISVPTSCAGGWPRSTVPIWSEMTCVSLAHIEGNKLEIRKRHKAWRCLKMLDNAWWR